VVNILESGLRKLFEVGINRKIPQGSLWVTRSDFKRIFPDSLKFKFRKDGNNYQLKIIWF